MRIFMFIYDDNLYVKKTINFYYSNMYECTYKVQCTSSTYKNVCKN